MLSRGLGREDEQGMKSRSDVQISKSLFHPFSYVRNLQVSSLGNRSGGSSWLNSSISPLDPLSCQLVIGRGNSSLGRQVNWNRTGSCTSTKPDGNDLAGPQDWIIIKDLSNFPSYQTLQCEMPDLTQHLQEILVLLAWSDRPQEIAQQIKRCHCSGFRASLRPSRGKVVLGLSSDPAAISA